MPNSDDDLRRIFSSKYAGDNPDWAGHSGPGSDPYYNLPYRGFLETFIRMNNISSVVDIGCGDWQFSRFLDFKGIDYLGLDLVESVVARNQQAYAGAGVRFATMPRNLDEVPGAHLLLMKDVLQHLPTATILDFAKTVFPKFLFCLITNSYEKLEHDGRATLRNTEIEPGGFRCLDLRSPPFDVSGVYVLRFNIGVQEELRTLLVQR